MKFIDFFCLITSKYDFQSITSKARDSILKFEKHQMHQIRNILILRLCTHFLFRELIYFMVVSGASLIGGFAFLKSNFAFE